MAKPILKKINKLPGKEKALLLAAFIIGLGAVSVLIASIVALSHPDSFFVSGDDTDSSVFALKEEASHLKENLKIVLADIKAQDPDKAEADMVTVQKDTASLRQTLYNPLWQFAEKLPGAKNILSSTRTLVDIIDEGCTSVLTPLIDEMRKYPLSGLAVENGFNVRLVLHYLDYLPTIMPAIESLVEKLDTVDLGIADREDKIDSYREEISTLLDTYHEYENLIPLIRSVLGADGDRLYVFAAQNSAEIRASGGFPGAVGSIRISDGILTVGDFTSVYNVFTIFTPYYGNMEITEAETRIYNDQLMAPRDACYCPDFRRVGHVWALAYGKTMNCYVDGCISMTPAVVQKLLAFLGEITLSDGTVLNGDNATKVLQYEIYHEYLTKTGSKWKGHTYEQLDVLWMEAAKATMHLMTSQFSLSHIPDYLSVIKEGTEDRTFMLWMADPEEQAMVEAMGWDGGLNSDPTKPEVGVYYSLADACKLGWYVDIDVELGEPVENEDGSSAYPVTVIITDTLDDETLQNADWYIRGSQGGDLLSNLHLFAPAGGSIDTVDTNYDIWIRYDEDAGLGVAYSQYFLIRRGTPLVVTFTVTTSPEATEPLGISMTPTLTEYR